MALPILSVIAFSDDILSVKFRLGKAVLIVSVYLPPSPSLSPFLSPFLSSAYKIVVTINAQLIITFKNYNRLSGAIEHLLILFRDVRLYHSFKLLPLIEKLGLKRLTTRVYGNGRDDVTIEI